MIPALVAGGLALALSLLVPLLGPLLVALIMGAIVANTPLAAQLGAGSASATKLLLRLGVVLLGLRLSVQGVLDVGVGGLVVIVATVAVTYIATVQIGDRLGLSRGFVTLLAAGFSICGAAAIAAVDDTVRAKERDVALAVAMVTVYGSGMILFVPWMGHVLGLPDFQAAIWAGASIHEVAQVVAAASLVGTGAIAVATTVKLGRVVLLAPMYAVASRRAETGAGEHAPRLPWFVVGFAIAIALRSTGALPSAGLSWASNLTTFLLAAGMFGLGLGIRGRELWPVPGRALLLASLSTLVAASTSLLLTVALT
jgi:uncharacterized integral membrane protein (TIGR00698 family)